MHRRPVGVARNLDDPRGSDLSLVQTTFWVEHKIWGLNPLPYHLVNVLIHAAAAVVLWRVLRILKVRGAWFGAALWALHPVQVESVAWVTELKNTQSGLFFLLAILFFCKSNREERIQRRRIDYACSLLCGALAMASKSSTVILPVVLSLCAWWMDAKWRWKDFPKLVPFFVFSGWQAHFPFGTQSLEGATGVEYLRGWPERIATSGKIVCFYLEKLVWPHPLMFIYPRWEINDAVLASYLPVTLVLLVLFTLWLNRQSWGRPAFMAAAYFVVALSPGTGLIDHYFLRYSFVGDHFQYLASIGVLALAGGGIARGLERIGRKNRYFSPAVYGLILVGFGALTWQQTCIYRNSETLWRDTLAKNPTCWMASDNLGEVLRSQGTLDAAVEQFRESIRMKPDDALAWNSIGVIFHTQGRSSEAMDCYHKALEIDPDYRLALANLATLLASEKRYAEALPFYERALRKRPDDVALLVTYGSALVELGRREEALIQFQKALKLDPRNPFARAGLINLLRHPVQSR